MIIPVKIDNNINYIYVKYRPYLKEFIVEMNKYYEIIIQTASIAKFGELCIESFDRNNLIKYRL